LAALQAIIEVVGEIAGLAKSKPAREKERRQFLFVYWALMFVGIAIIVWTIRSWYFSK